MMSECPAGEPRYLLIEPFYGGSHKQLIDLIHKAIPKCYLVTMTAKKWHWRSRVAALYLAQTIPFSSEYKVLFCSSVLNLAELVALRPDLAPLKKVIYFHENQLVYPVREKKDRDIQHGYNQILSSLVADAVVFNSHYNMESFLSSINHFLHVIPDCRPKNLPAQIKPKCRVIHFPLQDQAKLQKERVSPCENQDTGVPGALRSNQDESSDRIPANQNTSVDSLSNKNDSLGRISSNQTTSKGKVLNNHTEASEGFSSNENSELRSLDSITHKLHNCPDRTQPDLAAGSIPSSATDGGGTGIVSADKEATQCSKPLHIVWAHRWEHDKDPESFFEVVLRLHTEGCRFHLSVLGEQFTENLGVFETSRPLLEDHILHWGYLSSKAQFLTVLQDADVAVSTALHEFFGVSMLEAVQQGCYPLCPNRLVYPEIYPKQCLYNTSNQLFKMLRRFCCHPELVRKQTAKVDISQFSWEARREEFLGLFEV
ncbi:tRNA-queuosine alpha-mannosyltransferase-like [Crassostrea virginica]